MGETKLEIILSASYASLASCRICSNFRVFRHVFQSYQFKTSLDMFVELLKVLGALVEFRVLGALVETKVEI